MVWYIYGVQKYTAMLNVGGSVKTFYLLVLLFVVVIVIVTCVHCTGSQH